MNQMALIWRMIFRHDQTVYVGCQRTPQARRTATKGADTTHVPSRAKAAGRGKEGTREDLLEHLVLGEFAA